MKNDETINGQLQEIIHLFCFKKVFSGGHELSLTISLMLLIPPTVSGEVKSFNPNTARLPASLLRCEEASVLARRTSETHSFRQLM